MQHPSPENFFSQVIPYSKRELTPITAGKILNLDGFPADATLNAARQAYAQGIPTVFDMYSHPLLSELLRYVTYCIPVLPGCELGDYREALLPYPPK